MVSRGTNSRTCRLCGWWRPVTESQERAPCMEPSRADHMGRAPTVHYREGNRCQTWAPQGRER